MDYKFYCKKLILPTAVIAPTELTYEELVARPLTRLDLQADIEAVNSSLKIIRQTRGGSWPEEAVTQDFDALDLAWHEREFRDGDSYAYVVYDKSNSYIGCFYLYGLGVRTELTEELSAYEVDASWWVTAKAYEQGHYRTLYNALQQWLGTAFAFKSVYYSNKEIPA